ncbi:PE family protein, partial [Mycobacterium sp. 852002-51057_SCH5723018]|uniref:PE family protein n=1 Tax=Mycobacterium sp. 852002-51057_SCH5723018 TaxID=1834094 RepID=UPI000B28A7D7
MSVVLATPESMTAAATDLAGIRSAISAANAALAPTAQIQAAASDEVSVAISALFGEYGQAYQALSARASAFHDQFVQALSGAGLSYAATEAANASPLQTLEQDVLGAINAPTQTLLGRPLIGNGADGTAASP